MTNRIRFDDLPSFDIAPYLDCVFVIAVSLTDSLANKDPALLAAALNDIAFAQKKRANFTGS